MITYWRLFLRKEEYCYHQYICVISSSVRFFFRSVTWCKDDKGKNSDVRRGTPEHWLGGLVRDVPATRNIHVCFHISLSPGINPAGWAASLEKGRGRKKRLRDSVTGPNPDPCQKCIKSRFPACSLGPFSPHRPQTEGPGREGGPQEREPMGHKQGVLRATRLSLDQSALRAVWPS